MGHWHTLTRNAVFQMTQIRMEGIFCDRNVLRAKIAVILVHAERAGWIGKQMAHHPARREQIRYGVALNHITQQSSIHITSQQLKPIPGRGAKQFRKTTLTKIPDRNNADTRGSSMDEPAPPRLCRAYWLSLPETAGEPTIPIETNPFSRFPTDVG
jgi:hypothetical protein